MAKTSDHYYAVLVNGQTRPLVFGESPIEVSSVTSKKSHAQTLKKILKTNHPDAKVTVQKVAIIVFPN